MLRCGPKKVDTRTYSLEAIMALQKALEGGINREGPRLTTQSCVAQQENAIARGDIPLSLIARLGESFANAGRTLRQALRPILALRKKSKWTSARLSASRNATPHAK